MKRMKKNNERVQARPNGFNALIETVFFLICLTLADAAAMRRTEGTLYGKGFYGSVGER